MVLRFNRTGATNCDPPCTMRCPIAASPPLPAFWSTQPRISSRISSRFRGAGQPRSRTLLPSMSLIVRCGLSPISATSPANRYLGSAPAMPNRPNLMLEDPALRVSIVCGIDVPWSDVLWPGESTKILNACLSTRLVRPDPPLDFGHVLAMLADVSRMLKQLVTELLLDVRRAHGQPGNAVDGVDRQMVAVEPVEHDHIEWGRSGALLLEAMNMHLGMIGAVISQAMNQIRIAVIGKDHRPVAREHAVELAVADAVRMLVLGLQRHQIDD